MTPYTWGLADGFPHKSIFHLLTALYLSYSEAPWYVYFPLGATVGAWFYQAGVTGWHEVCRDVTPMALWAFGSWVTDSLRLVYSALPGCPF